VSESLTLLDYERRRHPAVHLTPPTEASAHRGHATLERMQRVAAVRRAVRERFTAMADEDVERVVRRACYGELPR